MFLQSGFKHNSNNVTDINDPLSPIELGNLIKTVDNNITENNYIALNDCVQTYYTDIENPSNSMSLSTLNVIESGEENDGSKDQETSQIGSLREELMAVKGIRKYISSSIEIQNTSLFSNTVELENALIYKMTMPLPRQTKVTHFFINVSF